MVNNIAAFTDTSLPPWERGVRQGGDMNIAVMTQNMLDFKRVMDKHGVKFILFFGTLLGAIRENTFITYDSDVDVLVFWDQYRDFLKVKEELRQLGFTIPDDKPIHDDHVIRNGEKIEMWWCGDVRGQLVYDDKIRFAKDLILPTIQRPFLETVFEIPAHSEKILEMIYGASWKTPNMHTKGCSYKAI